MAVGPYESRRGFGMRFAGPLAVFLLLAGCDEASGPLPPTGSIVGTWGTNDAGFIVSDTAAHAHVGCTYGDIHQAITLNEQGRFDVPGQYNINAYPVDLGILHPARFIGLVEGSRLTLTIVLTDTLVSIGPVTLIYGRQPTMAVCPICSSRDRVWMPKPAGDPPQSD
jgi:hypothetical protein